MQSDFQSNFSEESIFAVTMRPLPEDLLRAAVDLDRQVLGVFGMPMLTDRNSNDRTAIY